MKYQLLNNEVISDFPVNTSIIPNKTVYDFIDGMDIPEGIDIRIAENYNGTVIESLVIIIGMTKPIRSHVSVTISMNERTYGIPFQRAVTDRTFFLELIQRTAHKLLEQISAAEAFAVNQLIRNVIYWRDIVQESEQTTRLRGLVHTAIDKAYRE